MAAQPLPLSLEEFHKRYDGAEPGNAGWNPASEVRLKVSSDAEPVPDVIAMRGKLSSRYPASAPELCIEIMSPGDRLPKAFEKSSRYIQWGTECFWIIDPEKRTAWTLSQGAAEPAWISPTGSLRIGETAINLAELFEEVDRSLED